jgi:Protein of unknown function (DUF3108)
MNASCASHRRSLLGFLAVCAAMLPAVPAMGELDALQSKASRVVSKYAINFNGINIGDFKMNAVMSNGEYNLTAQAQISLLAGMLFEWNGNTASSGRMMRRGPLPSTYSFGYKTSEKSEKIDVKFSNNVVREIAVSPPQRPSSSRVPVTRKHMQNVVDPLSAVVMLTNIGANKSGEEVCGRRLPIFDGKARYDLQLSYKGSKTINAANGYKGPAYICKVKFIPIAGHKPNDEENSYAAKNEGIEVWMMPVTQAAIYIPYYIYLPTQVGAATLTSSGFDVDVAPDMRRALIQ